MVGFLMKAILRPAIFSVFNLCISSSLTFASLHHSGAYVGTSFGISQLQGKRSDFVSNDVLTLNLFPNKKMDDTSLEANLYAGYRYSPHQTNLAISLEGFVTYGPFEHTVYKDLFPGNFRNQVATLKRGVGYGMTARVGYIVHQQLMPYLLIGQRMDRFTYRSIDAGAVSLQNKRMLMGADFGAGLETCIGAIKTALEFKYTHYNHVRRVIVEEATGDYVTLDARPKATSLSVRFTYLF